MNTLQFIAELVKALFDLFKSLVWPALILMLVWFYSEKLGKLLDRLAQVKRFKAAGIDIELVEQVEKVGQEVEQLQTEALADVPPAPAPPDVATPSDDLEAFSKDRPILNFLQLYADPISGFVLARQYLERDLIDNYVVMTGQVPGLLVPIEKVIEELQKRNVVTAKMKRAINDLYALANQAIHSQSQPTPESAKVYVNSVQAVVDLLRSRAKRLSRQNP